MPSRASNPPKHVQLLISAGGRGQAPSLQKPCHCERSEAIYTLVIASRELACLFPAPRSPFPVSYCPGLQGFKTNYESPDLLQLRRLP